MTDNLMKVSQWLASLTVDECELVIKAQAFAHSMVERCGTLCYDVAIQHVRILGETLANTSTISDRTYLVFDDGYTACLNISKRRSEGEDVDCGYAFTEDEIRLLTRIVQLSECVKSAGKKMHDIFVSGQDSGTRKLSSMFSAAKGDNNSAMDKEFAMDYIPVSNRLFIKSGRWVASLDVGSGFVLRGLVEEIYELSVATTYWRDIRELYESDMQSDYGIQSPNRITDLAKARAHYENKGYQVVYSNEALCVMAGKFSGTDGASYRVYCANVNGTEIYDQGEFWFSESWIRNRLNMWASAGNCADFEENVENRGG